MQNRNNLNQVNIGQRQSFDKENVSSFSVYEPTNRCENEGMLKEFQTLKQINRILDSNPESQQAKDQKIRSLVVMFKRQLDINKKLQNQISDMNKKQQGCDKQLLVRNTQVKNYERTIFQQKQKMVSIQSENKRLNKVIEQNKQEINVRQELIQKMKQSYNNQKYSMQNELHYLKQKTLDHFSEKLNYPLQTSLRLQQKSQKNQRVTKSQSKEKQSYNRLTQRQKSNKKVRSSKKDILRRNILAISTKQNEMLRGQNLLNKFEQARLLSLRMDEIKNGNYYSTTMR